jgi:hypothetical protein
MGVAGNKEGSPERTGIVFEASCSLLKASVLNISTNFKK